VIGRPRPVPWWKRLVGRRSVAEQLVNRIDGPTVVVVDAESDEAMSIPMTPALRRTTTPSAPPSDAGATPTPAASGGNGQTAVTTHADATGVPSGVQPGPLAKLLTPQRILVWDDPVSKRDVLRTLAEAIDGALAPITPRQAIEAIEAREQQGSTFLNEGVALPHARVTGLTAPQVALGIAHAGVLDAPTDNPIEVVFMLLTPVENAAVHLRLLAVAGRALQDRTVRQGLARARTPKEALDALQKAAKL
jgi:mannitol/fructose-specific phosphotransferase system IIA component (Ntr-type)